MGWRTIMNQGVSRFWSGHADDKVSKGIYRGVIEDNGCWKLHCKAPFDCISQVNGCEGVQACLHQRLTVIDDIAVSENFVYFLLDAIPGSGKKCPSRCYSMAYDCGLDADKGDINLLIGSNYQILGL